MQKTFLIAAATAVFFLAALPVHAELKDGRAEAEVTQIDNLSLLWKPSVNIKKIEPVNVYALKRVSFTIAPVLDLRRNKQEIGRNAEPKLASLNLKVHTQDNVAAWMQEQIGRALSRFGLDATAQNSSVRLEAVLVKCYVYETDRYKSNIGLKIRALSGSGRVLWEGLVNGRHSRRGVSYSRSNYQEALSDGIVMAIHDLLKNDSFVRAVTGS